MSDEPRAYEGCGEDAAAYVLGALPANEHDAFLAHLAGCETCRREVAELQLVADALPAAVEQVPAPEGLRNRVLATVRSEAELRLEGASPPARARGISVRRRRTGGALAVAAAAVAVVLVLVLSGGGSQTRVIHAQVTARGARVTLDVSADRGTLRITGLPRTAPGHVYEVWLKRSGGPLPTDALFTVSARGTATVGVPGDMKGVTAVMVTAEPDGGSSVPTTTPVIVANLA